MWGLAVLLGCALPAAITGTICHQFSENIEAPCNEVLDVVEGPGGPYELRTYAAQQNEFWTNADVNTTCWRKATDKGFQMNFDYITGQNDVNATIPMTSPVLFRPNPISKTWQVSFFVPSTYNTSDDVPKPLNPAIDIIPTPANITFATKTFPGFANERDYKDQLHLLLGRLNHDGITVVKDQWSVVFAGYDGPDVVFGRHNEVWVHVDLSTPAEAALESS